MKEYFEEGVIGVLLTRKYGVLKIRDEMSYRIAVMILEEIGKDIKKRETTTK